MAVSRQTRWSICRNSARFIAAEEPARGSPPLADHRRPLGDVGVAVHVPEDDAASAGGCSLCSTAAHAMYGGVVSETITSCGGSVAARNTASR